MISQFFLLILFVGFIYSLEVNFNLEKNMIVGEKRYEDLIKKVDSYGGCWKETISDLHVGCKSLTEEVQSRLALSFANCFLSHAGSETCRCAHDVPISECLRNSNERTFSTYREFFTHTQSICHYLQHREWQEEATKTVILLTKSSQAMGTKLDESFKSQSKILNMQEAALSEQKRLISNGRILNAELQHSRVSARDMYNEFKATTHEQKFLLFQLYDKMKDLQNFVLGELTGVYTITYYVIAVSFIYIMTSVPRVAGARLWLMLLVSLNIGLERVLASYYLYDGDPFDANGHLYNRIWFCRKIMCSVAFIILIVNYCLYKDYNKINNQLLQEIQQQNKELQNFIKGLSSYENILKLSSAMNASTNSGISLQPLNKEAVIVKDLPKRESRIDISPQKIYRDVEGKENIPVSPTTNLIGNLKTSVVKQRLGIKSSPVSFNRENSLTELESPNCQRYNLRSSSRVNSPQINC